MPENTRSSQFVFYTFLLVLSAGLGRLLLFVANKQGLISKFTEDLLILILVSLLYVPLLIAARRSFSSRWIRNLSVCAFLCALAAMLLNTSEELESLQGVAIVGKHGFLNEELEKLAVVGSWACILLVLYLAFDSLQRARDELAQVVEERTSELSRTADRLTEEVSERKHIEEGLQRIRYAVDTAAETIFVVAPDGRILDVNRTGVERLEYTREELLQMRIADIDPHYPQEMWPTHWEEIRRDRELVVETEHATKSGRVFPVEVSIRHFEFEGVEYCCSFIRDLTDRRQAEVDLRQSRQQFDQLAGHIEDIFYLLDLGEQRVVYVSPAFEKIWGRPVGDVIENMYAWREGVHPEDRERVDDEFRRMVAGDKDFDNVSEYRVVRPDGSERWVRRRGFPIRNEAGELVRIAAVITDTTDRKLAEISLQEANARLEERVDERTRTLQETVSELAETRQRLATIVAEAPVVITSVTTEGVIDWHDGAGLRLVGLQPGEFVGADYFELWNDAPQLQQMVRRGLAGETSPAVTTPVRGVYMETRCAPLRDAQGQITGVITVCVDVSERVTASEEVRRHQDELAHVARLSTVGELATGLAHELNQPLTGIATYAAAALRIGMSRPEEIREIFNKIEAQARRAGAIIHRLKDLVAREVSRRDEFEMNEAIREAVSLIDPNARMSNIKIALDLEETSPIVAGDIVQIEQVVLNLVTNAIEAISNTEQNGAIEIRTRRANGMVNVRVADSGPGVDCEEKDRVFETFFSTKPMGLGMGLAISRTIVEAHGGHIGLEDSNDGGSKFEFALPTAK